METHHRAKHIKIHFFLSIKNNFKFNDKMYGREKYWQNFYFVKELSVTVFNNNQYINTAFKKCM